MIRGLYDYHRWANRRLFDVTVAGGEAIAAREVGTQFSYPTLGRMFGHLYSADWLWLQRWKGASPTHLPGAQFASLTALRPAWDALEREQEGFVGALTTADLSQVVEYRNTGARASVCHWARCFSTWPTTPLTIGVRSPPCSPC